MEETKPKDQVSRDNKSANTDLLKSLGEIVKGLLYLSESESEIQPFIGKSAKTVSKNEFVIQIGISDENSVEERNFDEFFRRLTEKQDWFEEEENAIAEKFAKLKQFLEQNLFDIKVYRVGKKEIDIYVVGLDSNGFLAGVKTKAVETG